MINNSDSLILTPDNDPLFYPTLYSAPLTNNRNSQFYIVNPETLLLENVSPDRVNEYVESGELEYLDNYWEESNDYFNPVLNSFED